MAFTIGLSVREAWDMTPRMLHLLEDAYIERERARTRQRNALAYNTAVITVAVLGASLKGRSVPEFDDIFAPEGQAKEQTPEQMLAMAEALTKRFGGSVETGGE